MIGSEKWSRAELLACFIKSEQIERAIRRKLSRELHQRRIVDYEDLAQWVFARWPNDLGDLAYVRQRVRDVAEDFVARTRFRG